MSWNPHEAQRRECGHSFPGLIGSAAALLWRVSVVAIVLCVGPRIAVGQGASAADSGTGPGSASDTSGNVSRGALGEARAALAAKPPNRNAARAALERTIGGDDDSVAVAEAYFRLGVLDEEDGDFASALVHQRACMAQGPSNFARSARLRIGWIEARSEGNFAPLARLQRVRRDPALLNDGVAIESLATDAEAFPPGRVRAEARMFAASAWMNRMNRREDAIAELHKVADDPSSDSMDATLAHRHLLDTFLAEGRLEEAESEAKSHPIDPQLGLEVQRLVRRRSLRRAARVELVAFFGLAVVGLTAVRSRNGGSYGQKVKAALHGLLPVALTAALALLCCVSLVAATFVWLDATHAKYLASLGL